MHAGLAMAVLLLAAALRLHGALQAHLWLDEFWMLEVANGNDTLHERLATNVLIANPPPLTSLAQARPWWSIWTSLDQVSHPPLSFILLRWWRQIAGPSEMAARLLPWLASVIGTFLMYRLVLLLHGPWPALGAMLLMALGPQQIYFAQELRPYSFLLTTGIAACYLIIRIEQRGPSLGRLIALGSVALTLVLTHYFSAGSLLALAVYAAVRLGRRSLARVALAFVVPAILFALFWGPFLVRQIQLQSRQASSQLFLTDPGPGHVYRSIVRIATIPAQALALNTVTVHPPPWLIGVIDALFLLPIPLSILVRRRQNQVPPVPPPAEAGEANNKSRAARGERGATCLPHSPPPTPHTPLRTHPSAPLLLWYLWFAGTLLPLAAGDLLKDFRSLGIPRYTLSAEIAVYGVIAAMAALGAKLSTPLSTLLAGCAAPAIGVLIAAFSLPAALAEVGSKPDWQPMIDKLRDNIRDGQPIVYAAENRAGAIVYLYASHYLDPSEHHPALILTEPLTPDLQRQLQSAGGQWVVFTGRPQTLAALLPNASIDVAAGVENHEGFMGGVVCRIAWKSAR
jgi:4-amino-4-deoxy-L-arabinose transferase-like glycosyltransferase